MPATVVDAVRSPYLCECDCHRRLTLDAPMNTTDDEMNLIVNVFAVVAFPFAAFTFTVNDFAPKVPLSQWSVPLASV